MRELSYAVEGKAANLRTFATDDPSEGGANHKYRIQSADRIIPEIGNAPVVEETIRFQKGPIFADGNGVNGIQNEDLLAILIDRLEGFQKGPYACPENAYALLACKEALGALHFRTKTRIARKVEGTHAV